MDPKTVEDETINKKILKKSCFRCQACFLSEHMLRRESYCPGITPSEHEAKLHFITLRAIEEKFSKRFWVSPGIGFFRTPVPAKTLLPRHCPEWSWSEASLNHSTSPAPLSQCKHNCPDIALTGHEATLQFTTLRAILLHLSCSETPLPRNWSEWAWSEASFYHSTSHLRSQLPAQTLLRRDCFSWPWSEASLSHSTSH